MGILKGDAVAHYALIDENNVVVQVITGRHEYELVDGVDDWETYYGNFHGMLCKRTSYNTYANEHVQGGVPFRKNYAGPGATWDEARDAFIPLKEYESWVFDEDTCSWVAPVPKPDDGLTYFWDEINQRWFQFDIGE